MVAGATTRADLEFTTGVETEIARAATIIVGGIADYQREVKRSSGPPSNEPAEWVVTARVAAPKPLKGQLPDQPVRIERLERSWVLPVPDSRLYWEPPYGDLEKGGDVVVFLNVIMQPTLAVPSGEGERDLAGLVGDIIRFRGLEKSEEKFQAWTDYLADSKTIEGRKAALRALCYSEVKWKRLVPHMDRLLSDQNVDPSVRGYGFGIVTYYVLKERWEPQTAETVDFLGDVFQRETDPNLTMAYLGNLGLVLKFAREERFAEERKAIREQVEQCLKQRRELVVRGGPEVDPDLEKSYAETHADILAGPKAEKPGG